MLSGLDIELVDTSAVDGIGEIEEDAPTLEGNATKKARAFHEWTGLPAIADDTGLEVEALSGRPGVRSARYAGDGCSPADNRALLLSELSGQKNRAARFRTVLALATNDGVEFFDGVCSGRITATERGTGGFGYDVIFVPDGYDRTFAELSRVEKNAISHRGRALRALFDHLRKHV